METTVDRSGTEVRLDPCRGAFDHIPLQHHPSSRHHGDQMVEMSLPHPHDQRNWTISGQREEKIINRIHSPAKLFPSSEEHHPHHHHQRQNTGHCLTSLSAPSSPIIPQISNKPQGSLPAAMARRNERERKRVRLVNHGFATLRQYLPQGHAKKKLSKMETLRSAISYIKQLQMLLGSPSGESVVPQDRWISAVPTTDGPSTSGHQSITNWEEAMVWSLQRSPGSTGSSPQTSLSPEVELLDFSAFS